ncbi:MAG: hypothetical protein ACYC3I_08045 [Gemmataceae bacterium]
MSAIERIMEKLQRLPDLNYQVASGTITVDPSTAQGFVVSLTESNGEYSVRYEGWHEHFASEEEALACFAFGFSDRCRLRIELRGSFPYRWTVEQRTEKGWQEVSTTGLLIFPFWRRRLVVYRQNARIRA